MASIKTFLGAPFWSGVAAIVAIIALILSFYPDNERASNTQSITSGNGNAQIQGDGNNVKR